MGRDVKIGLALGLVVIVVAVVIFSVSGGQGPPTDQAGQPAPSSDAGRTFAPPAPGERAGMRLDRPEVDAIIDPGPALGPGPGIGPTPPAPLGHPPVGETRMDSPDTATLLVLGPPEPVSRSLEHVVKAGDTLWALARKYYGDASRLAKIQEANRDKLATVKAPLRIGMRLVIPDVPADRGPAPAAQGGQGPAPLPPAVAQEGPAADYEAYTVRPGDTLSVIARRFYGDDRMIKPIVDANPRLAANPNRIVVGWQLRIPRIAGADRTARRDID